MGSTASRLLVRPLSRHERSLQFAKAYKPSVMEYETYDLMEEQRHSVLWAVVWDVVLLCLLIPVAIVLLNQ